MATRTAQIQITPGQGGKDFLLIHDRVDEAAGSSGFALFQPGVDEQSGVAPDGGFFLPASICAHVTALLDYLEARAETGVATAFTAHAAAVRADRAAREAAAQAG